MAGPTIFYLPEEISCIVYPCAACKIQRRKCGNECVLAPYFPPDDLHKFLVVHKIFGRRNITKILQGIPAERRADAVTSLVYEASARVNDPIYGCTAAIYLLQKEVLHLQSRVATVEAELLKAQAHFVFLDTCFCNTGKTGTTLDVVDQNDQYNKDEIIVLQDDGYPFGLWAPL
ncbi:hypothetical protein SUGI_0321000 [Cryptomeria japonica]|nr:hypothetical protein SUGI_0321000 [Cryptomeria japonica]